MHVCQLPHARRGKASTCTSRALRLPHKHSRVVCMQVKDAVSCWKEQGVSVEASQHDNQIYCTAHGRSLSLQHSSCLVKAVRQLHR